MGNGDERAARTRRRKTRHDFLKRVRREGAIVGPVNAREGRVTFVMRPFDTGDQRQLRNVRQGICRDHLVVVGDGEKVQSVAQDVSAQFLDGEDAIRGQRVDVQIAPEQAPPLGREGQVVDDSHPLQRNFVRSQQDAPFTRNQSTRPVARRSTSLTHLDVGPVRSGLAHLGSIRGDQTQVDDIDALPGRKVTVRNVDLAAAIAFVVVGERE